MLLNHRNKIVQKILNYQLLQKMKYRNQLKVDSLTQDIFFHRNASTCKLPALKDPFIYHNNDFNTRSNNKLQDPVLTIPP